MMYHRVLKARSTSKENNLIRLEVLITRNKYVLCLNYTPFKPIKMVTYSYILPYSPILKPYYPENKSILTLLTSIVN